MISFEMPVIQFRRPISKSLIAKISYFKDKSFTLYKILETLLRHNIWANLFQLKRVTDHYNVPFSFHNIYY